MSLWSEFKRAPNWQVIIKDHVRCVIILHSTCDRHTIEHCIRDAIMVKPPQEPLKIDCGNNLRSSVSQPVFLPDGNAIRRYSTYDKHFRFDVHIYSVYVLRFPDTGNYHDVDEEWNSFPSFIRYWRNCCCGNKQFLRHLFPRWRRVCLLCGA